MELLSLPRYSWPSYWSSAIAGYNSNRACAISVIVLLFVRKHRCSAVSPSVPRCARDQQALRGAWSESSRLSVVLCLSGWEVVNIVEINVSESLILATFTLKRIERKNEETKEPKRNARKSIVNRYIIRNKSDTGQKLTGCRVPQTGHSNLG